MRQRSPPLLLRPKLQSGQVEKREDFKRTTAIFIRSLDDALAAGRHSPAQVLESGKVRTWGSAP